MILLDTNVLEAGSFKTLDGPAVGALLAVARAKEEEVLLPEVVRQEFLSHRRRVVEEAVEVARNATEKVGKVVPGWKPTIAIAWPDPDEAIKPTAATLHLKIPSLKPGPGIAEEALRREIYRVAPASRDWSKPGTGARDAVIWLTALEAAKKGETVYLVSADGRAFGKNGRLLPELQAEADASEGKIIYCPGLPALFDEIAEPRKLTLSPESLLETDPAWAAADEMFKVIGASTLGPSLIPQRPKSMYFISNESPVLLKPPFDVHPYRVGNTTWIAFRAAWSSRMKFGFDALAKFFVSVMKGPWTYEPTVTATMTMLARLDAKEEHVIAAEVLDVTSATPDVQPFEVPAVRDSLRSPFQFQTVDAEAADAP